jgi:hypothetical protein
MPADVPSIIAAAESARSGWENWSDLGSFAVLVGVAIEFVTEFSFVKNLVGLGNRPRLTRTIEFFACFYWFQGLLLN